MNVLVTGHKGYIGAHLVKLLNEKNINVTGIDIGLFKGCEWEMVEKPNIDLERDFRSLSVDELKGFDCIMHLAAISNDPMGEINENITKEINEIGSIELARKAKQAGVKKFLFASSCSVYGESEQEYKDENSPLMPLSAYAHSKVNTELAVSKLADDDFCPVFLRNATAYGYSPMLRIDLVINNFLACAYAKGKIEIMSDGQPWRPLIHCYDIARAFVAIMEADDQLMINKKINIGDSKENFRVKDMASLVQNQIKNLEVSYTGEVGYDPRNYKVDFTLLNELLPNFKLEYDLKKGIVELSDKMRENLFSLDDFTGEQFVRLRSLRKTLHLVE